MTKQTPATENIERSTGFPPSYSEVGGDLPAREVWNQLLLEITSFLFEINQHGLLEWNATINYGHPALVLGVDTNGNFRGVYESVQPSINHDPTTDISNTYWRPYSVSSWYPQIGVVSVDADTEVLELQAWLGGTGEAPLPELGGSNPRQYIGRAGLVTDSANAVNIKGRRGEQGIQRAFRAFRAFREKG